MNLNFLICGALCILVLFGVFSSVLKFYGINRWMCIMFLLLSCIFSVIDSIKMFGIEISLNAFLFIMLFVLYFLKIGKVKEYFKLILLSLCIVAVLLCYKTFDHGDFDFSFVGTYVYVALALGFLLAFIFGEISTVFCGITLGTILFDVLFVEFSQNLQSQTFVLFETKSVIFILTSVISFCPCNFIFCKLFRKKANKSGQIAL